LFHFFVSTHLFEIEMVFLGFSTNFQVHFCLNWASLT
jgi:hypothetical protein